MILVVELQHFVEFPLFQRFYNLHNLFCKLFYFLLKQQVDFSFVFLIFLNIRYLLNWYIHQTNTLDIVEWPCQAVNFIATLKALKEDPAYIDRYTGSYQSRQIN